MLKSVRLQNFKTYEDATIEFDTTGQGTCIVGASDRGKTNILRALRVVLYNEDWPISWLRYGTSAGAITVTLADGAQLRRSRSKAGTGIQITYPDGRVAEFIGKNDAGAEVQALTGFRKITLDPVSGPEDIHIVDAEETRYLLGRRSDVVKRQVAGIVGANELELVSSQVQAKVRTIKQNLKLLQPKLAVEQTDLESIEIAYQALATVGVRAGEQTAEVVRLLAKLEQATKLGSPPKRAELVSALAELVQLAESLRALTGQGYQEMRKDQIIEGLRKAVEGSKTATGKVVRLTAALALTTETLQLARSLLAKKRTGDELAEAQAEVAKLREQVEATSDAVETARAEVTNATRKLGKCPKCQRPL